MSKLLVGLFFAVLCLVPAAAWADGAPEFRLITVKIKVADFDKTLDFYKQVLGMQETLRNPTPKGRKDGAELGLNFGATPEEAKANKEPTVVLVTDEALMGHVPAHSPHDVAPILLAVPDIDAVAKRIADFGATVMRPKTPLPPPYGGFVFMAYDPSGNAIEFIQLPKRPA
jgi:predicted enzyme related to lactoylglutathione lyase